MRTESLTPAQMIAALLALLIIDGYAPAALAFPIALLAADAALRITRARHADQVLKAKAVHAHAQVLAAQAAAKEKSS